MSLPKFPIMMQGGYGVAAFDENRGFCKPDVTRPMEWPEAYAIAKKHNINIGIDEDAVYAAVGRMTMRSLMNIENMTIDYIQSRCN